MIALVLGKNTPMILDRLVEVYGRKDIEGFTTLSELISKVKVRHLTVERIVCNATGVQHEQELSMVHDYLSQNNLITQVVLLARGFSEEDKQIVDVFHNIFHLPIYTDVLVNGSTDVEFIRSVCYDDIDKLRLTYSIKKDEKVSTLGAYMIEEEPEDIITKAPYCMATSGVLKTFTFGGKFFGRRRFTKQQQREVNELVREAKAVLGVN